MAMAGFQYMSLVYSTLFSAISTLAISWIVCRPLMPVGARWEDAKSIGKFGFHLMIGGLAYWLYTNLDDAIVGKIGGTNMLGLYSKAYYIATISSQTLGRILLGLSFPIFAKIKDDLPRLRRVYDEAFSFNLFICIPAIAGILILAEPITVIVFGPKWLGMIELLTLTCISSLMRVVYHNNGSLYKAVGRPDYGWKIALFMVAIIASLGYTWTISMGAPGMLWSIIVSWIFGFALHTYTTFWKIFPFERKRSLMDNTPIVYCTGIMAIIVYAVKPLANNMVSLFLIVGLGFGSYVISLYFLGGRNLVNEMIARTKRIKSSMI
jgi:O-antigen/teichoic acid export membrane protein